MKTFLSFILLMLSGCWSFGQFDLLTVKKAIGVKTNAPRAELHVKGNALIETNMTVRGETVLNGLVGIGTNFYPCTLNITAVGGPSMCLWNRTTGKMWTFIDAFNDADDGFLKWTFGDLVGSTNYFWMNPTNGNATFAAGVTAKEFHGNLNGSNISSGTVDIARLPTNLLTNNSTVAWFQSNKVTILGNSFVQDATPPILYVLSAPMTNITLHQGAGTGVGVIIGDTDGATGDWWVKKGGIVSGHWFGATDFTLYTDGGSHTALQVEGSTRLTVTNSYGSFLQVDCPETDNVRVENYQGFMTVSGIYSSNCVAYNNGSSLSLIDESFGSDSITNYCNGNSILLTRAESATNVNASAVFASIALTSADGCLNATNLVDSGSFGLANVYDTTNTLNLAGANSFSFLNAGLGSHNISSAASSGSFGMLWTVDSKDVVSLSDNNSFLQSQVLSSDNIVYDLDNSFCNLLVDTQTNISFTAANSLIIGKPQSNTTNSFTDTIGVTTDAGTSVFTTTTASIAGVGMTNGQVNAPLGYYQDHYSLNQSFTMFTNKQLYCVAGTNQVVTLIPAAANPWVIYRVTTTNGNGNFTITNSASDNATIRNGIDHTLKQIGVGEVGLFSDGANWQLASKARTVWPNAQFSCTTNIALTTAARAISFNSTDFNNSQGIALLVGTNATWGATSIWITNAGQYEFDPSIMQTYDGNHTITFWFKLNGANIANSATASKGQNGSIRVITVPFIVSITNTSKFEIWAISDDAAGESFVTQAAGGAAPNDYPASPSVICPVKRISDPRP